MESSPALRLESRPSLKVKANPLAQAGVGALLRLLALLPRGLTAALARLVGGLAFRLGIRRKVTLDNLRQALPQTPDAQRWAIARGAYRNMALCVLEALLSGQVRDADLAKAVRVEDWTPIEAALAQDRGLLVATAHFGSWELLGEVMARRGLKVNAVVRPLKGALNAHLMRQRMESGLGLIHPRGALSETLKALRRNEVVAMLIDQGLASKNAVFVPFFGRPAATTPAFSMAALRSGASVLLALTVREGDGLRLVLRGPFPVERTGDARTDLVRHTAQVTAALEAEIRQYPDQWLWLHRRWKYLPRA